jgi:MFS family permease
MPMPIRASRRYGYGHLIAAICFSIQALGVGAFIAFGVFFNPLMEEFGWSRAAISGASSLAFFIMGLFGVIVGRLNDRFGPRQLMTVTAILLGLGCVLMARLTTLWELYLFYGIIFGMGLSSIDVIALTTIARWFSHRRGFMTGIVKVGTGAGQLVIPLSASGLILLYGWRWSFVLIGTSVALILVFMAQFLRRDPGALRSHRQPEAVDSRSTDAGYGLQPPVVSCSQDGPIVDHLSGQSLHSLLPDDHHAAHRPPCPRFGIPLHAGRRCPLHHRRGEHAGALRQRPDHRSPGQQSGDGGLLRPASDRSRLAAVCPPTLDVVSFCRRLRFGPRGLLHRHFPLVAEWFGIQSHGALFGIVVCFGTTGGSVGPLLAGHLFDLSGSYQPTFRIVTAMALIAWGMLLFLRPVKSR